MTAVAVERGLELVIARRNTRCLRVRGAVEVGAGHYPVMVALHSAWLIAALAEVFLLHRPFRWVLGMSMLALVAATQVLRYWVINTLGGRWTTRVLVLPGEPLVTDGPFRWLRHPNYLAVALEVVALPLVHGAWWTALVFGVGNLLLLRHRVGVENRALAEFVGAVQ